MKLFSRSSPGRSLQWLLTIPYVLLVLGLAATVAALSYRAAEHAIDTIAGRLLDETVQRIGQAVERHVIGSGAVLEAAFPRGLAAPSDIATDLPGLRSRLWIATSLHRDPNNYAYYGNRSGQFVGLWRDSESEAEWRVKLKADQPRTIYKFTGIAGVLREPSIEARNFDPRERPWYVVGTRSAQQAWTAVYVDFRNHDLVATRARHVVSADGASEGVVATDLSLRALEQFVRALHVSPNGFAFIVEPGGELIAASNSANVVRRDDGTFERLNAAAAADPRVLATYRQLRPLLGTASTDHADTRRVRAPDGSAIEAGFARVTDADGLNWIIVVGVPRADFMTGVTDNVRDTVGLGLLAAVLVLLIGLGVVRGVTGDLRRLSDATRRIGDGDLETPIDIRRDDELGRLAHNFSLMQQRLRTDKLTGLVNREAIVQRIEARIHRQRRHSDAPAFAVLFVDVDDFKRVNDRLGHEAGDKVLAVLGRRLLAGVRDTDVVARYAGDEFIVLLDGVASAEAADEVRGQLEEALQLPIDAVLDAGEPLHIGGSIGLALYPRDGAEIDSVIAAADRDMYVRKAARGG